MLRDESRFWALEKGKVIVVGWGKVDRIFITSTLNQILLANWYESDEKHMQHFGQKTRKEKTSWKT
jgi:hypothetical protein